MAIFGGFRLNGGDFFFGELRGERVHRLTSAPWDGGETDGTDYTLGELTIDLPVPSPSKLIAVGLNYAEHIAEMKRTPLGTPLIWFKAPSSLLPHDGTIEIAFAEHQTHYEGELAIVIGRRAKNVSRAHALDHVFGYTAAEDISDRDLQNAEKQFGRAKSFDTYTPLGPFIHSEVDVSDLELTLRQNGAVRQQTRTSQMIYPVSEIVSFASQQLTLMPGDVILTGTPSGVGPIHDGDQLELAIGDWPPLRNRVAVAQKSS
ncbi:MAG: fumarylacetoacetate hydrolase family protein [Verrucomicrobiota bacterium]|nr:fumarylacetoacetate hydrolase family protein [Verrucomicrobiota bacterium]